MSLKYKLKRRQAKRRMNKDKGPVMEDYEKQAVDVFLKALQDKDCTLSQDPKLSHRMIEIEPKEMLVVLDTGIKKLTVTNSVYQYERKISERASEHLVSMFQLAQAKKANRVRTKYKSKVKRSLNSILDDLSKDD
jgi:hypothetical protein